MKALGRRGSGWDAGEHYVPQLNPIWRRLVPRKWAAKEEGRGISGQPRPRFLLRLFACCRGGGTRTLHQPPERSSRLCSLLALMWITPNACRTPPRRGDEGAERDGGLPRRRRG